MCRSFHVNVTVCVNVCEWVTCWILPVFFPVACLYLCCSLSLQFNGTQKTTYLKRNLCLYSKCYDSCRELTLMVLFSVGGKSMDANNFFSCHIRAVSHAHKHTRRTRRAISRECDRQLISPLYFTTPCPFFPCINIMRCDMTASWQITHPRSNLQNGKCYWEIGVWITALNHKTSDALMAVFMSYFTALKITRNEQEHGENNIFLWIGVPRCSEQW